MKTGSSTPKNASELNNGNNFKVLGHNTIHLSYTLAID